MATALLPLLRRFYEPVSLGALQKATVTSTASTLTTLSISARSGAGGYIVQGTTANIRYTLTSGDTPTAANGLQLAAGATIRLTPLQFTNAKFILESGTPVITVQAIE